MIKVVLIEDHKLVRSGLKHMLETNASIRVIGESNTGIEGIQLVTNLKPDVVILDINLPDISGLEVTHRVLSQQKSIKIMVVSGVGHDVYPLKLLDAGALSYLTKEASKEELIQAVTTTYAGQSYVSREVSNRLIFSQIGPRSQKKQFLDLSNQELEVLKMLIQGIPVKKIAKKLEICTQTVHSYRNRMFDKLHVKSNTGLIIKAIKAGLINLDDIEPT